MPKPVFDRPIAHRGLHDRSRGIIENSRSAFEAAIEGNFSIECDLQLSKDGIPIVFHDPKLERLVGRPGLVRDHTAAELTAMPLLDSAAGECPQTFADFLAQIAGRALLQVELKRQTHEDTARLAEAAAAELKSYSGPVTVESFDPQLIASIRRAGFSGPLGIIVARNDDYPGLSRSDRFNLKHLIHAPWSRFDFISCSKDGLDMPAIRFFRALGTPVTAWTIRSAAEATAAAGQSSQIVFESFLPAA